MTLFPAHKARALDLPAVLRALRAPLDGHRPDRIDPTPGRTRRRLVDRQLRALMGCPPRFAAHSMESECRAIAATLGVTPAIASALREQVQFLEEVDSSWAARFVEALAPGTDTAGLARLYAEHLSSVFNVDTIHAGARRALDELVRTAGDDDVHSLPGLLALAATETLRVHGVSGRSAYLEAFRDIGELLLRLLATVEMPPGLQATPTWELAYV